MPVRGKSGQAIRRGPHPQPTTLAEMRTIRRSISGVPIPGMLLKRNPSSMTRDAGDPQ